MPRRESQVYENKTFSRITDEYGKRKREGERKNEGFLKKKRLPFARKG